MYTKSAIQRTFCVHTLKEKAENAHLLGGMYNKTLSYVRFSVHMWYVLRLFSLFLGSILLKIAGVYGRG